MLPITRSPCSTVKEQPGSASVVQSISVDKYGLGYSGIGYKTAGVKAVPLGTQAGQYAEPTAEKAYAGEYPLARFLYLYVNRKPGDTLSPLTKEFLKLVLSKEGQKVVVKDGYYPISSGLAQEELEKIG